MSQFRIFFLAIIVVVFPAAPLVLAQGYGDWRPPASHNTSPPKLDSQVVGSSQSQSSTTQQNQFATRNSNSQFEVQNASWPTETIGESVRMANLEVEDGTFSQAVDAAVGNGNLVDKLKTGASDKISGLIGTMKTEGGWAERIKKQMAGADLQKMLGSLAVVLGGYFGLVWILRKFGGGSTAIPHDVVNVLGNVPFGPRKDLQLVRLGSKLLLLLNSPEGTHPIGEISDPEEVAHLTKLCPRGKTASSDSFRESLDRMQTNTPKTNAVVDRAMSSNRLPDVVLPNSTSDSIQTDLQRAVDAITKVARQTQSSRNVFEA